MKICQYKKVKTDSKKEDVRLICSIKLSFKWSTTLYNIFQRLKNIYKELFLCKSINQTAIWYIFLVFLLQLSFVRKIGLLLSFSAPVHSHRYSKQILFTSSAQLLIKRFSVSYLINFGLNKVPIKMIQRIYITQGWRPFFGTDETAFQFCLRKILSKVGSMR